VEFGLERAQTALSWRGHLIQDLAGTADLANIARGGDPRFVNRLVGQSVSRQVAPPPRALMHDQKVRPNDLSGGISWSMKAFP